MCRVQLLFVLLFTSISIFGQVPVNDNCDGAILIGCGDFISGSALEITLNTSNLSCHGYPDLWYKLVGNGGVVKFTYEDSESEYLSFDIYYSLCFPSMPRCENNFYLYPNHNYNFLTELDAEYLIRLEPSINNHIGNNFNFSIQCVEELVNDNCENAQSIECGNLITSNLENASFNGNSDGCSYIYGNDLWYTFTGDGNLFEFSILENEITELTINIYNEDCRDTYFNCFNPIELFFDSNGYNENASMIFASQPGVQYWFRLATGTSNPPGEFSFELNCIAAEPNDDCTTALPIVCGTTYEANLNGASFSDSYNGCDYEGSPDVWYTISGDGNIYSFEYLNSEVDNIRFRIYTGNCSQNLQCFIDFNLNSSNPINQFLTEAGQEYTIMVYSFNDLGTFEFSVNCPAPIEGDFCSNPIPLNCGSNISGNTIPASFGNDPSCYNSGSNNLWYEFTGTGDLWSFEFGMSDYRYIRFEVFEQDCSVENGQCLVSFLLGFGNFTNDIFNFPTEVGLTYYVKVELADDSSGVDPNGAFEFSISCNEPLVNDNCETATELFCGDVVEDTNLGATFDFNGTSCSSYNMPNLWYKIVGTGDIITLELNSSITESIDIILSRNSCDENSVICLDIFYLSSYNYTTANFHAELDSVYFLNLTLDNFNIDEVGEFSFSLTCHELEPNDDCINAITLACDDEITGNTAFATTEMDDSCYSGTRNDLWYSIEGDDALHLFEFVSSFAGSIRFQVFDGECTELGEEIFTFYHSNSYHFINPFLAYSGTTYYIRVTGGCGQNNGEFSFIHSCPEPYVNDFCEDAIELLCGSQYMGSLESTTVNYEDEICGSSYNVIRHDVWFTIEGDGLIYQFTDLLDYSNFTRLSIIEATCNQDLSECAQTFDIRNDDIWNSFLAETGKTYLIRLYDQQNESEFNFQVECFTPSENDNCLNPSTINCGESIEINFETASNMGFNDGCDDYEEYIPDLWYTLIGSNEFVTFSFDDPISSAYVRINIFNQNCENLDLECPPNGSLYQNNTYTFFTEMDSVYLIRMSNERNAETTINVICEPTQENDDCENAIDISCDGIVTGNTSLATSTMVFNGCSSENSNDVWYILTGTSDIFEFNFLSSATGQIHIQVYEEACTSSYVECNETISLNENYGDNKFFQSESGIEYYLRVSVGYNESGSFQFEINCLEPAENNTCDGAIIVSCNDIITDNSLFSTNSLDDLQCYNSFQDSDLWYLLEGDGLIYSFDLLFSPGFYKYVYVFRESCPVDNCGDYEVIEVYSNSSEVFYAESGVNYWLAVTSRENELGEFSLEINCTEPIDNDTCEQATTINCNETITGSTEFALPPNSYSNADVWYTFIGTGELIELDYNFGQSSRIQIRIYSQACGDNAEYEQELEITSSTDLNFLTQAGVIYYFQVTTGYSSEVGEFSFSLNCVEPLLNDDCSGAIDLNCGMIIEANTTMASHANQYNNCFNENQPDLWYTITGSNQIFEFNYIGSSIGRIHFEIYEGNCSDQYDSCLTEFWIDDYSNASYFVQSGTSYLIRVFSSDYGGEFSFDINCQEPAANDDCSLASMIACGDVIIGNTSQAGSTGEYSTCVINPDQSDLWYSMQGTGEIFEFIYAYSNGGAIRAHIYEVDNCTNAIGACPESLFIYYNSTNNIFSTNPSAQYLIRVTTGNEVNQNGEFSFEIACHEPIENDLCSGAIELSCGVPIEGTLDLATSNSLDCGANYFNTPGLWYLFESSGDFVYEITYITDDYDNETIYILTGDCGQISCFDVHVNQDVINGFNEIIYLPEGSYYFYLSTYNASIANYVFELNCVDPHPNDLCQTPLQLHCGDSITDSLALATAYTNGLDYCLYPSFNFEGPGLWYSIQGTGDIIQIDITTDSNYPQLAILNSDCEDLTCERIQTDTRNSVYFHSQESTNYLLYVFSEYINQDGEFTLSINCEYYGPSDPCSCNNDQSSNGYQDGTFSETISIFNSSSNFTWTITDISTVNGTSQPTGISVGDDLIYNVQTDNHEITFDHSDDSGYSIQIAGPYGYGIVVDTFTVSNICSYPEIDMSAIQVPMYQDQVYDLNQLITEIHNYPGTFEFYLDGVPISLIDGSALQIGEDYNLEIIFLGDFVNNTTADGQSPAFPGCMTSANLTFSISYPEAIPTLSQWALICLFLIFNIIGVIKMREKYMLSFDG